MIAPTSGANRMIVTRDFGSMCSSSALHHRSVVDGDVAAVAEEGHQDGEADGGLGGGDGQHEHGEDLPHHVVQIDREGHQVDVHREQDQLDRHQDDDDVLAVHEDAEDPDREQDRGDREIVGEPDGHWSIPWPGLRLTTRMPVAGPRRTWSATTWRFTPGLWRSVSTMAPIMATSSTMPAAWKK